MKLSLKWLRKLTFIWSWHYLIFFTIRVPNPPKSIWDKIILNFFLSHFMKLSHILANFTKGRVAKLIRTILKISLELTYRIWITLYIGLHIMIFWFENKWYTCNHCPQKYHVQSFIYFKILLLRIGNPLNLQKILS